MNPLNKFQKFLESKQITNFTSMRKSQNMIQPVVTAQLPTEPPVYLFYIQTDLDSGSLILQVAPHATTVLHSLTREIKDSRRLSLENIIEEMTQELNEKL